MGRRSRGGGLSGPWGLLATVALTVLGAPSAGRAAIALVGNVGTNGDTTSGTSISVSVGVGGVAADHTLVVAFAMDPAAGTVSCGDSRGNVYAKDADVTSGSGTSGVRTVICSAAITVSLFAGDTITVTHPTVTAKAISVHEFSGLAPSGTIDRTATAAGTSTTASSGFTLATNQVDELLVGALGVETSATEGFTAGSGYTGLTPGSSGSLVGATSNVTVNPEYRIVAAKGSYSADGILAVSRLWGGAVATYRARCGNGTVDAGEPCDKGAANSACCSASCTLEATGTVCRGAADICDAAETCSGASAACPADGFQPAGTACRAATDLCDAAEACSGTSAICPADALQPAGAVCRAAADACDVAELCTGSSAACAADGFQPAGTVCRGAADTCDAAELCTGGSAACPADIGTPGCTGPPPGVAFVKHVATGGETTSSTATSVTVPSGGVAADTTLIVAFAMDPATGTITCGDSRGNVYTKDADVANGTGTSGVRTVLCSAPITVPLVAGDTITVTHPAAAAKAISVSEFSALAPSGGLDRTATGTGSGLTPSSGFTAATRQSEELVVGAIGVETQATEPFTPDAGATPLPRASSGAAGTATTNVSLNAEFRIVSVLGSYAAGGTIGPSRLWGAAVATYRAKCGNGTVDAGEPCDKGVANSTCCSATCQLEPASTVCRAAGAVCDAAETCSGTSASCPADGFQPAGTICRTPSDLCDAAETCTGAATACPADGVQPAGTVCRGVADACDAVELCTGASASCPTDSGSPGCSGPAPGLGFVKTVGASGDATSSTATSVTVPASGVVADDTLIVVFAMDPSTGTVSCGDTKGNVYTKDADVTNGTGVSGVRTVVFSAPVTFALDAGDTISVAHPTVGAKAMSVSQFGGLAPTGALDRTATATGTSATPSSGFTAGTRQLDELLIGVAGVESHGVDPFVAGTGYVPLPSSTSGTSGGSTTNITLYPEFRVVSAVGSYGAGGTIAPARLWATAIATYRAKCGNAVVDPGEPCDGAAPDSACCLSTCQLVTAGTPCRVAASVCDAAEACTGASGACPPDGFLASGTTCRAAADVCDAAEACTGADSACPADTLQAAGTTCRPVAGACDVAEACTGGSAACPADDVATGGFPCRAAAGPCDVAESCSGASALCPSDAKSTAICRPAAGSCDAEERCDGGADACPADGYLPASAVCRPAATACDVEDHCTGASPICPADTGEPDGDADGVCDAVDPCPLEADAAQGDADTDGVGDACDPCTNLGPVRVSGSVLTFANLHTPGGDDLFTWKGTLTLPAAPSIDPAARGIRVLVTDALGSAVLDVFVPGGAGWKAKRKGAAWQYTDRTAPLGIAKVTISGSRTAPGRLAFVVQGKGGSYPAAAWKDPALPARLPLSATLVLDPPVARDGHCGETGLATRCAFSSSGKRLRCE